MKKKESWKTSEKRRKKKEWNEIGDRCSKADDKKGRCFMIYEITKAIFP